MSKWQGGGSQNRSSGFNGGSQNSGQGQGQRGQQGQQEEFKEKKWYLIQSLWFDEEKGSYSGQGFRVGRDRNGAPIEPHGAELKALGDAIMALSQGWPVRIMPVRDEHQRQNGPTHHLMAIRQFEEDYEQNQQGGRGNQQRPSDDDVPF